MVGDTYFFAILSSKNRNLLVMFKSCGEISDWVIG